MVKREVAWTKNAEIQLREILDFYTLRNKSGQYSQKLYRKFKSELNIIAQIPEIGINTKLNRIKGLIVSDYILFYEILEDKILVLKVWDTKQDPDKLNIAR